MARTGTTALTAYIASHPQVKLVVGGALWHRLESDYVRTNVNWSFIDGVLDEFCPYRILLKQPWLERNEDFFERAIGAKVLYCTREMDSLYLSWATSPYAGEDCRYQPDRMYLKDIPYFFNLMSKGAMRVRKEKMSPELAKPLGKFLRLDPSGFDPERIIKKWEGAREREWIEARAIWRDKE